MSRHQSTQRPVHLGLKASAVVQAQFTNQPECCSAYLAGHASDGIKGRLMTTHGFTNRRSTWQMHPSGAEVVLCMAGTIAFSPGPAHGSVTRIDLPAGEYAIKPLGVWHTANAKAAVAYALTTAGRGTERRERH